MGFISASLRTCTTRSLSLTSQLRAKPHQAPGSSDGEENLLQPIKFSTSKASHRTWKVERSMGSRFQRPWWQVLPLCVFTLGFLLWCIFRQESDIDRALEKQLFEHLPGLLTNSEEEETEEKEELQKEPNGGSKWIWFLLIIIWTFILEMCITITISVIRLWRGRSWWARCLKKIVKQKYASARDNFALDVSKSNGTLCKLQVFITHTHWKLWQVVQYVVSETERNTVSCRNRQVDLIELKETIVGPLWSRAVQ